jgi:hypothetical protein
LQKFPPLLEDQETVVCLDSERGQFPAKPDTPKKVHMTMTPNSSWPHLKRIDEGITPLMVKDLYRPSFVM